MAVPENISIIFKPSAVGLQKFWGKLEAEILEIIWTNGPMTVKRALYFAGQKRKYAYTTIMTVMRNLTKKGILARKKKGHAFVYDAVLTKSEFLNYAAEKIIAGLTPDYYEIALSVLSRYAVREKSKKNNP
jgi:predicted transcriptional regulator